jgi:hypothetical protein
VAVGAVLGGLQARVFINTLRAALIVFGEVRAGDQLALLVALLLEAQVNTAETAETAEGQQMLLLVQRPVAVVVEPIPVLLVAQVLLAKLL